MKNNPQKHQDYIGIPTTESQRELLALLKIYPELVNEYITSVFIDIESHIDINIMLESLKFIFNKHDSLRSTFSDDGLLT